MGDTNAEPQFTTSPPRAQYILPFRFRLPRPLAFDWFPKRSLAIDWFLTHDRSSRPRQPDPSRAGPLSKGEVLARIGPARRGSGLRRPGPPRARDAHPADADHEPAESGAGHPGNDPGPADGRRRATTRFTSGSCGRSSRWRIGDGSDRFGRLGSENGLARNLAADGFSGVSAWCVSCSEVRNLFRTA